MIVSELFPIPSNKIQFKLAYYKSVPQTEGCYVLTTFDNQIIYIGLSNNLYSRFKQHLDSSEKKSATREGKAVWFYYESFAAKNLPKLERTWINQFTSFHGKLPVLNKINSPIS